MNNTGTKSAVHLISLIHKNNRKNVENHVIQYHQIISDIYTSKYKTFRRLYVIRRSDFALKKHCLKSALY